MKGDVRAALYKQHRTHRYRKVEVQYEQSEKLRQTYRTSLMVLSGG